MLLDKPKTPSYNHDTQAIMAINCSRAFRSNMRSNTCRVVLLTSMFWLLIDVVLVMRYSEFFNDVSAKKVGETDVEVRVVTTTIITRINFYFFFYSCHGTPTDWSKKKMMMPLSITMKSTQIIIWMVTGRFLFRGHTEAPNCVNGDWLRSWATTTDMPVKWVS